MTVEEHLSQYGFTMRQARDFIMDNYVINLETVYNICLQYNINNDMIVEILQNDISGLTTEDVSEFFTLNGFNGNALGFNKKKDYIWNQNTNSYVKIGDAGDDIASADTIEYYLNDDTYTAKVKGNIHNSDNDFFKFEAPRSGELNFSFNTNNSDFTDLDLIVYDNNNKQQTLTGDSSSKSGSYDYYEFNLDVTASSTYYFELISESGVYTELDYELELSIDNSDSKTGDKITDDHGNNKYSATTISLDTTINGEIEVVADEDCFKIYLNAGNTYSIKMDGNDLSNYLALYDANGWLKKSDYELSHENYSEIEYTPLSSGYYYIIASDMTNNDTGDYTINVTENETITNKYENNNENEVSDYLLNSQPYINIGIIQATFEDGSIARGTASIVGENDILTATHVIYDPTSGGWAESYEFYFGVDYNDVTSTFENIGYHYIPTQMVLSGWPDSVFQDSDNSTNYTYEASYDIAIIGVDDDIGNDLGWLGLDGGYNSGIITANAVGYPEGATGMLEKDINIIKNDYYNLYESTNEVFGPGSSGGPLLIDNYVIGVKSTSTWWADIGGVFDNIIDIMDENDYLIA